MTAVWIITTVHEKSNKDEIKIESNRIESISLAFAQVLDDPDYSLVKALQTAQQNFVITDPTLPDNPIVFASQGFLELTGYTLDQVKRYSHCTAYIQPFKSFASCLVRCNQ